MKANKILGSIVIILITLFSCDKVEFGNEFLEKDPGVDVTKDTIFNDKELALRFLTKGYSTLPYGLNLDWGAKDNKLGMDLLESLTDLNNSFLSWSGVNQLYYSGQYSAPTENTSSNTKYHFSKEQSWEGIRIAYIFIENVNREGSKGIFSDIEKKQYIAEAKMIAAVHYVDMYRHFGGLPWVDKAYRPSEEVKLPRLSSLETMEKIVALLDEAEKDLPLKIENLTIDDGRFTKLSALGLKTRLLLFGASPLFNSGTAYLENKNAKDEKDKLLTWHGSYKASLWQDAANAAKATLDEATKGGYKLVSNGNARSSFKSAYYDRGNGEILISTRARFRSGGYWATNFYFYQSAGGYGIGNPTTDYVEKFPMATTGKGIYEEGSGYNPKKPWENRDPRLYETVLVNGDDYRSRKAELWIGGQDRLRASANACRTGYGLRKFLLDGDAATSAGSIVQWPYLRLAEIYLSYAEALNEINNGPTPAAFNALNACRIRVGVGTLKAPMTKDQFRTAVLNERAIEFGYEEVRWFDLARHKLKNELTKPLRGTNTTLNPDGSFTYTDVELPLRHWQKDNGWSDKWFLSAFPPNEVNKGYGLIQNPGW